ncbi:MAG: hypothetical protein JXJ04_21500 [Spirochaetales bacterium]|nr:hypothetical protein [Spirochaetales bacterium]
MQVAPAAPIWNMAHGCMCENVSFLTNLRFAVVSQNFISGGIEGSFSFTDNSIEGLVIKVFPFISFITPGVLWNLKYGITLFDDPLPYENLDTMFEGFIGIKAEF